MSVAILGVGVAATVAIVGVAWGLSGSPSCPREGALLTDLAVESNITLREFLDHTNASTEGYDRRQLNARVNAVSSSLAISGYTDQHLTLKWSMYDGGTGIALPSMRDRAALDIQPTTCETRLHPSIWTPATPGSAYIRLTFQDEAGNILAERKTPRFGG